MARVLDKCGEGCDGPCSASVDHLRRCIASPAIEVSGSEAMAQSYLIADGVSKKTGKPMLVAGFYEDRLRKDGGRWYFAERRIHVHHSMEPPKAAAADPRSLSGAV